jgi:hypothetical protein
MLNALLRKPLLALPAAVLALGAVGTPAHAAPRAGYVVTLAAPLAEPRQDVLDGALWKCAGDRCSAAAEGSRPVLVCGRVARKFGEVARFTAPDGDLAPEALERCNTKK